jgi:hypothetical protein
MQATFPAGAAKRATNVAASAALPVALLIACLGPVSGWLWPEFNWDMLAYIAVAQAWLLPDPSAAHAGAYLDAARFAQAHGMVSAYNLLAHGSAYRETLANDPIAFDEVLRFYRLRPLYEALVIAVGRASGSFAAATIIISSSSVLAANLAMLWFAIARAGLLTGVALFAGFALSPPIMTVAGYSTADALGTAFVTFAAIAWMRGQPILGAAILLASVGARSDFAVTNIIVAAMLLAARLAGVWRVPVASLVLLVLSYPLARVIESVGGAYPFKVLYYNTFVAFLLHPANPGALVIPTHRFISALYWGIVKGLANGAYAWPIIPMLFFGARAWVAPPAILALAFVVALAVRIVVFPEPDIRLVAPIFAVGYVVLIETRKQVILL